MFPIQLLLSVVLSMPTTGNDDAVRNQLVLYKTQADYAAKKGEALGEFMGYDWTVGTLKVFWYVTSDGKKRKTENKNITSYYVLTIDGRLYRIMETKPYAMLQQGNFCYYENGFGHMNMVVENEEKAEVEDGRYCFVSKDLISPLYHIPSKDARKAFADMPQLNGFFDCVEKLKGNKVEKIRECMKAAN